MIKVEKEIQFNLKIEIPIEILHLIISFIHPRQVIKFSLVNKEWKDVCFSDVYWKDIVKKSYEDLFVSSGIKKDYCSFFKETWIRENIKNGFFEPYTAPTTVFQPIKEVYSFKSKENIDQETDILGNMVFYNGCIVFSYDDHIHCVSKKDFKLLWKTYYKQPKMIKLDIFSQTLFFVSEEKYFIFLSDSGKEIRRYEIDENERIIDIYKNYNIIVCYSIPKGNSKSDTEDEESSTESYLTAFSLDCEFLWKSKIQDFCEDLIFMDYYNNILYIHNYFDHIQIEILMFEFETLRKTPKMKTFTIEAYELSNHMYFNEMLYCDAEFFDGTKSLICFDPKLGEYKQIKTFDNEIEEIQHYHNALKKEIFEIIQHQDMTLNFNICDESFNIKSSKNLKLSESIDGIFFMNDGNYVIASMDDNYESFLIHIFSKDLDLIDEYRIQNENILQSSNVTLYQDLIVISGKTGIFIYKGTKKIKVEVKLNELE